jgi:DNA modification methylase
MRYGEGGAVQDRGRVLDLPAYRDVWGKGIDSYLHMLFERFTLIKKLLAPTGNLFVHVDHRANSAVRLLLDEVFGPNLLNEIIWQYNSGPRGKNIFGKRHDTIFRYARNPARAFMDKDADAAREPYSPDINVPASKAHYYHPKGKVKGDVWRINIPGQNDKAERTGYDTQKPEALLEQIIAVCCPENGLVADFFCGSGTTGAVAEKLGRRWLMADAGTLAIHTCRKRLIDVQRTLHADGKPCRGFDIHYLESSETQTMLEASRQPGKGALEVELVKRKARASSAKKDTPEVRPRGGLDVRITKFIPPLDSMPGKAAEMFRALIDKNQINTMNFWAVDFDWQPGRPFHHDWQDYHFRRNRAIKTTSEAAYVYAEPGPHTIAVKVIDLFGEESYAAIDINLPSDDATV